MLVETNVATPALLYASHNCVVCVASFLICTCTCFLNIGATAARGLVDVAMGITVLLFVKTGRFSVNQEKRLISCR